MSVEGRRKMIDEKHRTLSISRQCGILGISRSSYYRKPSAESDFNLELMRKIDEQYLKTPFYGSRRMKRHLVNLGYEVGRRRVKRLMRKMGIEAIYRKPTTSKPNPEHKIYPYLLRNARIDKPDRVWCADITYIPMNRGWLYLVAVMDWHSRAVLSWRLSNGLESDFCVAALEEALFEYGVPEIFNTDQGSQFTSGEFIDTVETAGAKVSMDGKGRWMDNVFIERLWRSLKWECVYLNDFETVRQARMKLGEWFDFYNGERPHSAFDGKRPIEIYFDNKPDRGGHAPRGLAGFKAA